MNLARKKVLLVLECGSAHGVGHQVAMISRYINHALFSVTVVYGLRPGTTREEFEMMTARADARIYMPEMVRSISPLSDLIALCKLWALMRREKPDVVHAHSSKAGILARAAACLAGVPRIFYSPHGYSFLQSNVGPFARRLYWWIEKAFSGIGHIVAGSGGEAALARKLSWESEVYLVRNLFSFEEVVPVSRPHLEVVIGAVGRLTYARNPQAFLKMAHALSQSHPETHFVWVGGGELQASFTAEARRLGLADRLTITGHIPRAEVLEKLASMDIFIHYSRWEGGAPIALHEAFFFGKAVITSGISGNTDLVIDGKTGLLAENDEDLLRHTTKLVMSSETRAELGRSAQAFLKSEVSVEKSICALQSLYAGPSRSAAVNEVI